MTKEEHDRIIAVLSTAAVVGGIGLFEYLIPRRADPTKRLATHRGTATAILIMIVHLIEKYSLT